MRYRAVTKVTDRLWPAPPYPAAVSAGRSSVITYVAPVVAVALGVAILDESVGVGSAVGLVLIVAGSRLATEAPS